MNLKKMAKKYAPDTACILVILLFSFAIMASQFLTSSWPYTQDDFRYLYMFEQFKEAFTNGILYPRWLPDTYKGYGYPLFVFYQPGIFYLTLPFSFLCSNIATAMQCSLLFLLFTGGYGVYLLAKKLTDKATGLFCGILFLLTPYLYVNMFFRGDLSELMAMLLTPWPLYFILMLKDKVERDGRLAVAIGLVALSLAAVIMSHPAAALFFMPLFLLISFYLSFQKDRRKQKIFLLTAAFSVLLALVLSSPYWLTVFMMKKYVWYEGAFAGTFSAEENLLSPSLMFAPFWRASEMSLQLGAPHFILALLGFLFFRRNKFIQASFVGYLALVFAMSPFSAFFWKHIQLIRYIQFPWRILSVTAVFQALCAAGIFCLLNKKPSWKWKLQIIVYPAVIIMFIICNREQFRARFFSYDCTIFHIKKNRTYRLENPYAYQACYEALPRTMRKPAPSPRGDKPLVQVNSPNCIIKKMEGHSKFDIRYSITAFKPMKALVNQLYFPGMQIILDGTPLTANKIQKCLTYDGRVYLDIQPGAHTLEIYYEGPPGWKIRNIIIGLILLAYLIFLAKEDAKIRNGKDHSDEMPQEQEAPPCPANEKE